MSEMIERVARALAVADGMHPHAVSNDEDQVPIWKLYVDDARMVMETMLRPTDEMLKAGTARDDGGDHTNALGVYQAMIDAALNEDKTAR